MTVPRTMRRPVAWVRVDKAGSIVNNQVYEVLNAKVWNFDCSLNRNIDNINSYKSRCSTTISNPNKIQQNFPNLDSKFLQDSTSEEGRKEGRKEGREGGREEGRKGGGRE